MPKCTYQPKKSKKKYGPKAKTHTQYVKELAAKKANIIPTENYITAKIKINHECSSCGNTWKVRPTQILAGSGCPICSEKSKTQNKTKSPEQYKIDLINTGFIVLEEYKLNNKKILHKCIACNHEWKVKPQGIIHQGNGCPECSKKQMQSKGEKEVAAFIKEIYNGLVIENDRTILKPKELDVYLPEIGFAVEYNGNHWHRNKPKGYHSDKTNRCAEQGIKLLHVWESDWKADVNLWKYNIQEALLIKIQSALPI